MVLKRLQFRMDISSSGVIVYVPIIIFFCVSVFPVLWFGEEYLMNRIADDAFYYIVVARNVAELGESSFLPGVPTNGYHPLWMIMLAAVGSIFGFSLTVVKLFEIAVVCAGFVLFLRLFPIRNLIEAAFYTFALWYILRIFALQAMETSLIFPALVLLFACFLSRDPFIEARRPLMFFLSSGIVIGARLDAALFVLPILAVAPISGTQKLRVLIGLIICGVLYTLLNIVFFGAAIPISASVKSLGGLQFNELYFNQLMDGLAKLSLSVKRLILLDSVVTPWVAALVALLSALAVRRNAPASPLVLLLYASTVGMLLFGAKLLFGSSWRTWAWYGFPIIVFALPLVWLIQETLGRKWPVTLGMGVLAPAFFMVFVFITLAAPEPKGFAEINRRFLETNAALLGGEVVAMGDRAGSFAYRYEGGVYQTEGLVNSSSYLDVLKAGGEMRGHLCSLGIELFLDYEVPHDDYDVLRVEVLRSALTSFPGPYVTVYRSEEISHYDDVTIYGNRKSRKDDHRLYAWRLNCDHSL